MINPADYTITVKRIAEGDGFVFRATVKELPHLVEFADTYTEAYELALDAIESLAEAAKEEGREFPTPSPDDSEYSGRVTLRMPKSLHRQLSDQADAEGVSFNHFLVSVLAFAAARGLNYFGSFATRTETVAAQIAMSSYWSPLINLLSDDEVYRKTRPVGFVLTSEEYEEFSTPIGRSTTSWHGQFKAKKIVLREQQGGYDINDLLVQERQRSQRTRTQ